jgi:hypothetical protein
MPQFARRCQTRVGSAGGSSDFIGQTIWGAIFPLQKIGYFNRLKS